MRNWFDFIKDKQVKTVRQIMRERGLVPARTAVDETMNPHPRDFQISAAYPNPFNPEVHIRAVLTDKARLTISIYNIRGQFVHTEVDDHLPAGEYVFTWNGSGSSSGIYLLKSTMTGNIQMQKLNLVR